MASAQELSNFLHQIERRAFKQTVYAIRDEHAALDIVQDAMLKLAEKYPDHPVTQYPMLFQRILQNTMRDFWRRQKVRTIWTSLLSSCGTKNEDGEHGDPLETMDVGNEMQDPAMQLESRQTLQIIEIALETLPARQREAFILRYWEGMSVVEAADVMACSQGSVKTHCSRALRKMVALLTEQGLGTSEIESIRLEA